MTSLRWKIKHLFVIVMHKLYVFYSGIITRTPLWQLLVHDLSKLSRAEFGPYARFFQGPADNEDSLSVAWRHHYLNNPHHWNYFVNEATGIVSPMPEKYVREMVADWLAAGRAYEGEWPQLNNWRWLELNLSCLNLHSDTVKRIKKVLAELGMDRDYIDHCFSGSFINSHDSRA